MTIPQRRSNGWIEELRGRMSSAEPPGESSAPFSCCPALAFAAVGDMGHTEARFEQVRPRGGRVLASQIVRESRVRYS